MQKGTGWKESASLRNSFLYRLPQTAKAVTLSSFGVHGKPNVCCTTGEAPWELQIQGGGEGVCRSLTKELFSDQKNRAGLSGIVKPADFWLFQAKRPFKLKVSRPQCSKCQVCRDCACSGAVGDEFLQR